jgi:branched-chain amino acid transport system ATP-binding protein
MGGPGDILLNVEHLTMRFGGLVAVDDLSFAARKGDITALIGPNGAGKTTVFNCITGFYKPSEGRLGLCHGDASVWSELEALTASGKRSIGRGESALYQLERMPDFLVTQQARVARTFQNIRLFPGMTVLENLLVAQHNRLMLASGYTLLGILGFPSYAKTERAAIEQIRPATYPMARSAGWRSRAPCARNRYCSASTSRPRASIRTKAPSSTTCCWPSATATPSRSC